MSLLVKRFLLGIHYYITKLFRTNCATVRQLQVDKEAEALKSQPKPVNQLEFAWEMVRELVMPLILRRLLCRRYVLN